MKRAKSIIGNVFVSLVAVIAVCMMIYTVVTVTTVDRNDRSVLGYRMLVVLSDSMSATDFNAGDLIFVKETDPATLKPGDIIAFTSQAPENYGETVAHKIRSLTTDEKGKPGFITYGTTTGVDDGTIVTWPYILGKYQMRIPAAGKFFSFLKTVPGYLLFILLPFLILIIFQGMKCVRLFREYRQEEMEDLMAERERLRKEREETMRLKEELDELRTKYEKGEID